jgi:YfiH family protein
VLALGSLGGGVRFAFTCRSGGFSGAPYDTLNLSANVGDRPADVAHNRQALLGHLRLEHAVWLRARHGAQVRVVGPADAQVEAPADVDAQAADGVPADGLVTSAASLGLASLSADCALVVLADPDAGVIATAHCGRVGLVAGIIPAVVAAMREQGASRIKAALGPTICGVCYEVPERLAAEVVALVPSARSRGRGGVPALDIAAGALAQLDEAGVMAVRRVGSCTREDPAAFSYRRDHVTGRLAALVWRSP